MPQKKPKVSVIMPAYNVEKYVGEAIESILKQTFTDFEFIILNDGSTDNTSSIIREYAKKDKRIKFIDNKTNKGFIASLNECLDVAQCEYIAKMDSDDISKPTRLAKQVDFLEKHPDYGMVGCGLQAFQDDNFSYMNPPEVRVGDFLFGCKTTVFVARREIIEQYHLRFDSNYFAAEDMEFYSRFARYAKIHNLQEILYLYRVHKASVSKEKADIQAETTKKIQYDVARFLFGDENLIDKYTTLFRWVRIFGIPIIKIKTYNMCRSKYYLFGRIPLILLENNKMYLFGFIKIGVIR
ncbi:MAG: glycosyltransferase family 2 protein [Alphaproteobacteria bacterium]|nr:glycosyltransferase family 2 protein [Alphaproteobacteria bacterium]